MQDFKINILSICTNCAKDEFLKKYINEKGIYNQTCILCKKENLMTVDFYWNKEIRTLVRALVRIYFSEFEYSSFWGGVNNLPHLLYIENPILTHIYNENDEFDWVELEEGYGCHRIDLLFETIFEKNLFTDQHEGNEVSLFNGPSTLSGRERANEGYSPFIKLTKDVSSLFTNYELRLQSENHFILESELIEKFLALSHFIENNRDFTKQMSYFRARIGYNNHIAYQDSGIDFDVDFNDRVIKVPYMGADISCPPPPKATAGRLNRVNVSYLYLSSDSETAISEIRPHPSNYVSIGEFSLLEDIRIADFRKINLLHFFKNDRLLDDYVLLSNIAAKFSIPITPEEKEGYLFTQLITEVFRKIGFDGICFNSSISNNNGYNLVIFNPNKAEYKQGSSVLKRVEKVKFETVNEKFDSKFDYENEEDYIVFKEGRWQT
ncbi:RES family NAD+ phosphorylase [Lysinibacillus sp. NPDC097195]|uniref:RES family NAD+ phosphorylase n=1 Tax=Lysinibacillus sp. NPDC097195 TaxID=3364141 RepID=UPI00381D1997